jgi:hypothetical protein
LLYRYFCSSANKRFVSIPNNHSLVDGADTA